MVRVSPTAWKWKALFSTRLDRHQHEIYKGFVVVDPSTNWMRLLDVDLHVQDARRLQVWEFVRPGSEISFVSHRVKVQDCIFSFNAVSVSDPLVEADSDQLLESNPVDFGSMAVHAAMTLDLDFSPGMAFAKDIQRCFSTTVHPSDKSGHFTMVVSFVRASFRLDEDSVGLALEAAIGGYCGELKVSLI